MKSAFLEYFEAVEISKIVQNRLSDILQIASNICPEDIEKVFVSNFVTEDGMRQYTSFWMLSSTYVLEAKQFLTETNIDIAPFKDRIAYLEVSTEEYDFCDADIDSKLNVHLKLKEDISCHLRATGNNCGYLKSLLDETIKQNLMT